MFEGKRVVVTGATSGIGFASARAFLDQGASVIITGRSEQKLMSAAEQLDSDRLHPLLWDVTDFSILEERVQDCVRILGGIDIFVNNAGVALPVDFRGDFFGTSCEDWDTVFSTNVKSVFFICQKVIRYMLDNGVKGNIVNVCSETAFRCGSTPYGISKTAVNKITETLGRDFVKQGIVINAVAPGATVSNLQSHPNILSSEQIADIILFLASDKGRIIAGETVIADRCEHFGVSWFD